MGEALKKPAGILLAAGGSRRLGEPKQLLRIHGNYLINHMIGIIRSAGIDELVVVLGSSYEKISEAISDGDIDLIRNPEWEEGISSSIRKGLEKINDSIDAAIIFVVDQPFLSKDILERFISFYEKHDPEILVTRVGEHIVHPVLYKRRIFEQLKKLEGDKGGKQIFNRNTISHFDLEDKHLLIDIDTGDDLNIFEKLQR
ncbi:MAG: nucleotidyltransferase family protein [Chloroflexi bacterium]|nr:nucleotidyltransferase family protein [Chloroflexota bacterium]